MTDIHMIKASAIMHTIKTTPKITATVAVVLFGFALIAAPKVHPIKKIMNAAHTRTDGFISWLMVNYRNVLVFCSCSYSLALAVEEIQKPVSEISDHVNLALFIFFCLDKFQLTPISIINHTL